MDALQRAVQPAVAGGYGPHASGRGGGGDLAVPDQFPVGLRVLVVDDDLICLKVLEQMLRRCAYDVLGHFCCMTKNHTIKKMKLFEEMDQSEAVLWAAGINFLTTNC